MDRTSEVLEALDAKARTTSISELERKVQTLDRRLTLFSGVIGFLVFLSVVLLLRALLPGSDFKELMIQFGGGALAGLLGFAAGKLLSSVSFGGS